MKLYLAADSSLELIRYLRSVNGEEGLGGTVARKRKLDDAICNARSIDELDNMAQSWLSHVSRPIHAFVDTRSKCTSTKQLRTSLFSLDVPYGTMINLGHDICICSPSFTFTQLATHMEAIELLKIGMEFCGTYSRWRLAPVFSSGLPHREFNETQEYTFDLPPIMNAQRVTTFIKRMKGYQGARKALAASQWLANGSASPMETATYLLLHLPKRMGGYGLTKPVMNPLLIISNPDGTKRRYPDLFWYGPNIDVEYNSDADHSGEWACYRDSRREVELTVANVRVLPLTRPQLMDVGSFDAFANGLRRLLGIRTRPRDPEWTHRRAELRRGLLSDFRP